MSDQNNGFNLTAELQDILRRIVEFLPNVIGALLILIIGYFISLGLAGLSRRILRMLRFDRAIHASPAGSIITRVIESPARFVSRVVFWLVMIGAISLAVSALNLPLLNNLLVGIYGYVPNIIAAVIILVVASAVSTAAVNLVSRLLGRTALAKLISAGVPAVILSLAVFMILNQLGIARDIINILFTAIVGSAALGLALAFGLGGREVARDLLEQAAEGARARSGQVRDEARAAVDRAQRQSK